MRSSRRSRMPSEWRSSMQKEIFRDTSVEGTAPEERSGESQEDEPETEATPEAEAIERALERAVEKLQVNADRVAEALIDAPESSWTDDVKLIVREVGMMLYSLANIATGATVGIKLIERGYTAPGIFIGMSFLVGALQMDIIRKVALASDLKRRSGTAAA